MPFRRNKGLSFSSSRRIRLTKKKALVARAVILAGEIAIVLVCAFLVVYLAGMRVTMLGSSMEPTIGDGEKVLVNRMAYYLGSPDEGDIVVFVSDNEDDDSRYIKRVAACGGDTVYIENGVLYVNDEECEYTSGTYIESAGLAEQELTVGDDEYFVIGDNINESGDSRFTYIGNIKKEQIIGRVWLRFNSVTDFGSID